MSSIGTDSGAILLDQIDGAHGLWEFVAYEGDVEHNEHGRILNREVARWSQHNLITTVGKGLILDRIFALSAAASVTGTAVGTGSVAAAVGDTALTTPTFKVFDATPVRAGLVVTATTTFGTAEANINIQEAGLLTASGGVLLNRLAPVLSFTKTTALSLAITTTITQA